MVSGRSNQVLRTSYIDISKLPIDWAKPPANPFRTETKIFIYKLFLGDKRIRARRKYMGIQVTYVIINNFLKIKFDNLMITTIGNDVCQ